MRYIILWCPILLKLETYLISIVLSRNEVKKKIKETYIDYFLWIFPQKSISVENLCIKKWYLHGRQNSNLFITEMFFTPFYIKKCWTCYQN